MTTEMSQLDTPPAKIICLAPTLDSSLFDLRLRRPLERCANQFNYDVSFVLLSDCVEETIHSGDFFIVQRDANQFLSEAIALIKRMGKVVIFEIDDLLTELPDFLGHHKFLIDNKNYLQQSLIDSTLITTTTARLAGELKKYNQNVEVVPNCAGCHSVELRNHFDVTPSNVSVIVASSDRVLVDMVTKPIYDIQQKYHIQVIAIGPISTALSKAGIKIKEYDIMPYDDFLNLARSVDNLIGVIPLDSSLFSSCKSPIKYFDYSLSGVPTVASKVAPYVDFIEHEKTGLLVKNTDSEWFGAIQKLVLSYNLRQEISANAQTFVKSNYHLDVCSSAWNQAILKANKLRPDMVSNSIDSSLFHIKPNYARLSSYLFSATSYKKAFKFYRKYGVLRLVKFALFR